MTQAAKNSENKIFTVPNLLSLFRLLLVPLCIWLYCWEHEYLLTAALLVLSGVTDVADGFIARRFHMVSNIGKVLDPIADKLTQAAMLFCLTFRYPHMIYPLLLMVAKELVIGITGWLAIKKTGQVFGAKWHGKAATVLLYSMLFLHLLWLHVPPVFSDVLIIICFAAILLSFILYAVQNLRLIFNASRAS